MDKLKETCEWLVNDKVSRINQELGGNVRSFQSRQFDQRYPYVYLDGIQAKVLEDGQSLPVSMVVAVGVSETGGREPTVWHTMKNRK